MKREKKTGRRSVPVVLIFSTILALVTPSPVSAAKVEGNTTLEFSANPVTLSGDSAIDVTITTTTTATGTSPLIDDGKVMIQLATDGSRASAPYVPVLGGPDVVWMTLNAPGQNPVDGITTLDLDLDALGFVCGTVGGFRAHYVSEQSNVRTHFSSAVDLTAECDCECEATETAFAFDATLGTCFLDMGLGFNRWGWSIGPLVAGDGVTTGVYEFPIYAGAGQCDTSKGQLVGELLVSYVGGTVTVTYEMDSCRTLTETHLYVGNVPVPSDGQGGYTVAPGQYGNIHDGEEAPNAESDQYVITGLSGEIYIIAHAVVCVEPAPVE